MALQFEDTYPNITRWVKTYGWIEVGQDELGMPVTRALDAGGIVWEAEDTYVSVDSALQAMEASLAEWLGELDA